MCKCDKKYNGYTNYETWAVNLWWDNEEYLANELQPEWVEQADGDISALADRLKDYVTDPDNGFVPDLSATFAADLLNAALSEVDWYGIVENWL